MLRIVLAAFHLVGFAIGIAAVWARSRSLREEPFDIRAVRRAFTADTWWGIAALLSIGTGAWRLDGGVEKATSFYTHDWIFLAKLRVYAVVFALELWPMITLIRWRSAMRRRDPAWEPSARQARWIGTIGYIEVALLVVMVFAAVSMARGFGYRAQFVSWRSLVAGKDAGSVRTTHVPSPGLVSTSSHPPSAAARSRIPRMPKCPLLDAASS
jgi:putative membrane protein